MKGEGSEMHILRYVPFRIKRTSLQSAAEVDVALWYNSFTPSAQRSQLISIQQRPRFPRTAHSTQLQV